MDICTVVIGILSNMLSNDLQSIGLNLFERIKLCKFKKDIDKWLRDFIISHDGSVLTKDVFEGFLKYHRPIERMFLCISGDGNSMPKENFIEDELIRFQKTNASQLGVLDRSTFIDFFSKLYDKINAYYQESLVKNEKYIAGVIKAAQKDVNNSISASESRIVKAIESGNKETQQDLERIIDLLEETTPLSNPDEIWDVYSVLSTAIMNGYLSDVRSILSLVERKNNSLKYGLEFLMEVLSQDSSLGNSYEKLATVISDERVYSDLVEKSIYLLLAKERIEDFQKVGDRDIELYDIAHFLAQGKFDTFFNVAIKKENGINYSCYNIQNNYPNHVWLIKRTCVCALLKEGIYNACDAINQIIGTGDNIVDRLLISERRVRESYSKEEQNYEAVIKEMDTIYPGISQLSQKFQCKYYEMCLRARLSCSNEIAAEFVSKIPETLKRVGEIEMLCLQVDINRGIVNEASILNACTKSNEYWLLNNYLLYLINNNQEKYAKEVIDKYRFVLEKEVSIFLLYVQLLYKSEGEQSAKEQFEKYKPCYESVLDYWQIKFRMFFSLSELEEVSAKWLDDELSVLSITTIIDFIEMLLAHEKNSAVIQSIQRLEIRGCLSKKLLKFKALALARTQQEIEALELFKRIFSEGEKTEEIAYYILSLSMNNKREVAPEIISIAKGSDDARLISLAAGYSEMESEHEEARRLIRRAVLRCDQSNTSIYGQYIRIHTKNAPSEVIPIKRIDENTTVQLIGENGNVILYCIHPHNMLPHEPYVWEGASHIYIETAIKLGLVGKKQAETVQIDDKQYTIGEIEPIDVLFCRICMEKLVDSGTVKVIKTAVDESGHIDLEEFTNQFLEIAGDDTTRGQWIEQYKDLNSIPAPLYQYRKYVRVPYTKLIDIMINDPSIIYRELLGRSRQDVKGYVLSVAALVALKKLNYIPNEQRYCVVIPSSLSAIVLDELNSVIAENKKDTVASMGVNEGNLYFVEASEEQKNANMADAVDLKEYTDLFEKRDNDRDIVIKKNAELDIKELVGISDYDALSIAKRDGLTIISAEMPLSVASQLKDIDVDCVPLADFLANICGDWKELMSCTKKLMGYKFLIPITEHTLERLESEYGKITIDGKKELLKSWEETLNIPQSDKIYRGYLSGIIREMLSKQEVEKGNFTPIKSILIAAVMNYSGYSIQMRISDEGTITTELIKSE